MEAIVQTVIVYFVPIQTISIEWGRGRAAKVTTGQRLGRFNLGTSGCKILISSWTVWIHTLPHMSARASTHAPIMLRAMDVDISSKFSKLWAGAWLGCMCAVSMASSAMHDVNAPPHLWSHRRQWQQYEGHCCCCPNWLYWWGPLTWHIALPTTLTTWPTFD